MSRTMRALARLALLLALTWMGLGGAGRRAGAVERPADVPDGPCALSPTRPPAVLAPDLARALAEAEPDAVIPVIVVLREQAPLILADGAGRVAARKQLVDARQALAARTQPPLRARLDALRQSGLVESYTPFWIFNGLAVRARPAAIRGLAEEPAVATIHLDHYRQWIAEDVTQPAAVVRGDSANVAWGVARIRADEVWASLHVSGTGAVVAGMDTGADWLHPSLHTNYRGYHPRGLHNHVFSWYDAVGGAIYPIDDHGHGTHTLGSAVGTGGIGVAPGARWIAVKVLDGSGRGYDSWIHAGFQWLLAPGGDPSRAPDVVNCSWGNPDGSLTTFRNDLRLLRAAGIVPVFSSGNNGPLAGTVGSPASLPEAFAVGASDETDYVAVFSSRGPSPWLEVRPHVVAPGVAVRSSLPGGVYGVWNGTSMAAPHVTGIVALLRSVSPTLSITRALNTITGTAHLLGSPLPNNDSGWGRVDALPAVTALVHPGVISGTVRRAGSGHPLAGAQVAAFAYAGDGLGPAVTATDSGGRYRLTLAAGVYSVTASAFGFAPSTAWHVTVVSDTVTRADFALTALPTGTLRVRVWEANAQPLTATLRVLGTPLEVRASAADFALPPGSYTVRARELGYRIVTATTTISVGQVVTVNLSLPAIPRLLLVDSGAWYFASQIGYYRQALDDLAYAYDEWTIAHLPDDVPRASTLQAYDVLIWSAPLDAPGYVGAEDALVEFLKGGGRLFLSGQDIGYLDGGGGWDIAPYYRDYLKARWLRDDARSTTLAGAPGGPFSGMAIAIAGPGGADNQLFPDEVASADPDAAVPTWLYTGDGCGGLQIGTCLDYRALYFAFGFEGITSRALRQEAMRRALDWLAAPPPTLGLELTPAALTVIGPPGSTLTHTLRLRHVGQAGEPDTFVIDVQGTNWATTVSTASLVLSPCQAAEVAVRVSVPITAGWNARDLVTVTARSGLSPTVVQTAVITSKTPAPVLLVDDDRFYDQGPKYRAAVEAAGLPYDLWEAHSVTVTETSPPLERLCWYPVVVWWTGHDWYRPLTEGEQATLRAYLDSGGRLFLSSQGYLLVHPGHPFGRFYLGVLRDEPMTAPKRVWSTSGHPVGAGLGPTTLIYPFLNWSGAVEPTPGTAVALRDEAYRALGLARRQGTWGTVFFSFPFEALPEPVRPQVLEQTVGWLSWLGSSGWSAAPAAPRPGDLVTFTLRLVNDGPVAVRTAVSNTLPISLTLVEGSLDGPWVYTPTLRRLGWGGTLGAGESLTLSYTAAVTTEVAPGARVDNSAWITIETQGVRFRRSAPLCIGCPRLAIEAFRAAPEAAQSGEEVGFNLQVSNDGQGEAAARVTMRLPAATALVSGSVVARPNAVQVLTDAIRWVGPLAAGERISISYRLTVSGTAQAQMLYSPVVAEDGWGGAVESGLWVTVQPRRRWLPIVLRR